jgi:hypothetical protein
MPPERKWGFRAGSQPDSNQESFRIRTTVGRQPAGGHILIIARLEAGRNPSRKPDLRHGSIIYCQSGRGPGPSQIRPWRTGVGPSGPEESLDYHRPHRRHDHRAGRPRWGTTFKVPSSLGSPVPQTSVGREDPHNVQSPVRALAFGFGGGDEDALAVVAVSLDLGATGGGTGAGDETFALAGPAAFVAPCGTQPSVKITICITESNRKTPTRTRPARISKRNITHLLYSWNVEHRTFHLGVRRSLRFCLR